MSQFQLFTAFLICTFNTTPQFRVKSDVKWHPISEQGVQKKQRVEAIISVRLGANSKRPKRDRTPNHRNNDD